MHRAMLRGPKVPNSAMIEQTQRSYQIALGSVNIGKRAPAPKHMHSQLVPCVGCPDVMRPEGVKQVMKPFKPLTMQELRERMTMTNTEVANII